MTVPGRVEAARLLWSLDPPVWFVRHVTAVAEVASWLALRASQRGIAVDRRIVESAALLHDVDKTKAGRATVPGIPSRRRLGRVADRRRCRGARRRRPRRPVTRLVDERVAARVLGAPLEVRLVAYADKRAQQRLVSMDQRFATWIASTGIAGDPRPPPWSADGPTSSSAGCATRWASDRRPFAGSRGRLGRSPPRTRPPPGPRRDRRDPARARPLPRR